MPNALVKKIAFFIALIIIGGLSAVFIYKIKVNPPSSSRKTTEDAAVSLSKKIAACNGIPNGSTIELKDTSRQFINLPQDIYPDKENNLKFQTLNGSTTAGWISNAGPYGESMDALPGCWSYYYEFDGKGTMELTAKSSVQGYPDYKVNFVIQ